MGDCGIDSRIPVAAAPAAAPTEPLAGDDISVLVTGFGPFKTNSVNASYLIASSLPASLSFPSATSPSPSPVTLPTDPGEPAVAPAAPAPRRISIHVHPSPIPVAYSTVREIIPTIVDDFAQAHGGRRPDIVIHMGIASGRNFYSVETQAHRDSYQIADVKGHTGYEDGEKRWKEQGLPAVLRPGPALTTSSLVRSDEDTLQDRAHSYPPNDHFLDTWKSFVPVDTDVRLSTDAGRYLCEFIFYTTMANALHAGRDRNVVFFHVPGSHEAEAIELGRNVAVALIKTLVTCWIDEKS